MVKKYKIDNKLGSGRFYSKRYGHSLINAEPEISKFSIS